MHKIYIAAIATLVILQQAINPVQFPAATAHAAQVPAVSIQKSNYNLNLNTKNKTALELKDTRATFDTAVLAPLKAAQEAKAKADADAANQAASAQTTVHAAVAAP